LEGRGPGVLKVLEESGGGKTTNKLSVPTEYSYRYTNLLGTHFATFNPLRQKFQFKILIFQNEEEIVS
jgi:hypothetical protein